MRSAGMLRRRGVHSIILAAIGVFVLAADADAQRQLKGGFETASTVDAALPWGWSRSTTSGGITIARVCNRWGDRVVAFEGLCAVELRSTRQAAAFGAADTAMIARILPVADFQGKLVTVSARIRTEGVGRNAARLFLRIAEPMTLDSVATSGNTPWHRTVSALRIPARATMLQVGVLLSSGGTAWIDDVRVTVDGRSYDDVIEARQPTSAQRDSLRPFVRPFGMSGAELGQSARASFDSATGRAQVIALGESTHGMHEFFVSKAAIIRHLVADRGFRALAMESSMAQRRAVNAYIQTGKGDLTSLVVGLGFWGWNTDEVADVLRWLRDYNASGRGRVQFFGFDTQLLGDAVDSLVAFARLSSSTLAKELNERYAPVRRADARMPSRFGVVAEASRGADPPISSAKEQADAAEEWIRAADSELRRVEGVLRARASGRDAPGAWPLQYANMVAQAGRQLLAGAGVGPLVRDSIMATNVRWIREQLGDDDKLIVWAHDSHVVRSSGSMGGFLARTFGDRMRVVTFVAYDGSYLASAPSGFRQYTASPAPPGSLEDLLNGFGLGPSIIDMRRAMADGRSSWLGVPREIRQIGTRAAEPGFRVLSLPSAFDVAILTARSTPSLTREPVSRDGGLRP